MTELLSVNEKLVEVAYQDVIDDTITLAEYEQRLEWYLADETPPKRIHRNDIIRLEDALLDGETAMLWNVEYRLMDDGKWYGRVEERI